MREMRMEDQDLQIPRQSATLRLLVEEKLRSAIASGRFKPGQRLVERELCEQLGVGRTSIREALRQLEAEGLITTLAHRGPVVTVITYEEAMELYKVRALLEGFLGQEFAEHGSDENIADLDAALKSFEKAARSGKREELAAAKTRFYDSLINGAGNSFVRQILTQLHNRVTQLRIVSMTQPGRLKHSLEEIREIAAAIRERDPIRAAAACSRHVEMAAITALEYLRKNGREV
jgi:DNA-binding GntR family transcriptional regulator